MHQPLPTRAYVCHGVTWSTGSPRLLVAPLPGGPLEQVPVIGRRLAYRAGQGRWCTGRYQFTDTTRVEPVPCPGRLPAAQGGQCERCAQADDFRHAHRHHLGGPAPEPLRRYMAQPHWLYLATFADGTTKVGTAADSRKRGRLDEQGALFATYLAKADDGRAVRYLEDALSRRLQLPQAVRGAAKLHALAELTTLDPARDAHRATVDRATTALQELGTTPLLETWTPPAEQDLLRHPSGPRALYPHVVRHADHGFTPTAAAGSHVLAHLDDGDDLGYLLDLGALKGCHLTPGPYTSPDTAVQTGLF